MRFDRPLIAAALALLPFAAQAATLNVAVAANVQYAFDDLAAEFKKESGIDIKASYGASGKFASQIMNGAPFDVFLSADMDFPAKLADGGFTVGQVKPYAYGTLVLWTMKDLDLKNWANTLTSDKVAKIAVANPKAAPYGREAIKALAYYKIDKTVEPKLVYGENISQANQYISTQAADIGFTAKSVVISPELKGQGRWVEVPKKVYEPIAQGVVVLKQAEQNDPAAAKKFYDFLSSKKARAVFQRFGYQLP
ncbi:molybdate ABC transporter substrate-binding protein [Crenobacter cavernae]|uniref:Molybdate ABC transporter substrate-binding protein n=1 Tax=Crenobacter cavernae TaxID=2290923 RepID=A0ABY0FHK7_9NEIS|nr:molybdate ABC transporter substrate-binding protein [Crenobacter cavernae]RXZ44886.1 molybdate ABC transporter substrate-binding protein [Crenobacter cavernae]